MSSKAKFLGTLSLFGELDNEQLEALAEIAPEYEFEAGAIIAFQRDVANSLFIVRSGRLFASTVDVHGRVRETRSYEQGDCFEDTWLINPRVHSATVKATEPGHLIIIDGPAFLTFLVGYPDIVDALEPFYDDDDQYVAGLSEEAWEELEKSRVADTGGEYKAASLSPDELVEYWTRRSRWLLWIRIGFRTLMLLFWVVGYLVLSNFFAMFRNPWFALFFLIIPTFLLAFFILYEYIDWRNDYLMITNRQILHYEYDISLRHFGKRVQKTPIDRIQSVSVVQPNLLSRLLNLGTARITTAAQAAGGTIVFDYISDPKEVQDAINRLQVRVRELDVGQQQALLRRTLATHFSIAAPYEMIEAEQDSEPKRTGLFGRLRQRFATRLEIGGEVTYRKSRIFLLFELRWAFLLSLILVIAGIMMYRNQAGSILWLIWGLFAIIDAFWFIWEVEDWRNDQYRVNDRYVLDIDRKPFGLGESRKQADLVNIQNVGAVKSGLMANIFQYGNVSIETAGATADIVFERVAFPDLVQQDIFLRRERLQKMRREADGAQRRDEYALLLDVYQQISEQGQIPRRTPTTNLDEE